MGTERHISAEKRALGFRVLTGHSKDCYAIKNTRNGSWSTPWAYMSEPIEYRDAIGRRCKSGHYRWLHVRCNCTHCPAWGIVRENDILEMLPHG